MEIRNYGRWFYVALIPSIVLFLRYGRKERKSKTAPATVD